MVTKGVGYYLWIGLTLAILFFYPLIASLAEGLYYMSWQLLNTVELVISIFFCLILFTILIIFIDKIKRQWLRVLLLCIVIFIPFSFFIIHIIRQAGWKTQAEYIVYGDFLGINIYVLLGIVVFMVIALFWHQLFRNLYKKLITSILILSPISILSFIVIIQYGFNGFTDNMGTISNLTEKTKYSQKENRNVFVFLFDELDYSFLYDNGIISNDYPNLRIFSEYSKNYHAAKSPGDATLVAIPRLLVSNANSKIYVCGDNLCTRELSANSKRLDTRKNIFKLAQSKGFKTSVIGWMHPYCKQYGNSLDYCRSYSIYNYSTFNRSFSLLNPVYTNFILLPHQKPFGLVKTPIYSRFHHRNVSLTHKRALQVIEQSDSVFAFFHYSIPHLPFIYIRDQYAPPKHPFLENKLNYKRQLQYVDTIFGEIISTIKKSGKFESSTIIVLSDHGYRKFLKSSKQKHVPMLVYDDSNAVRSDIKKAVMTQDIINNIINKY